MSVIRLFSNYLLTYKTTKLQPFYERKKLSLENDFEIETRLFVFGANFYVFKYYFSNYGSKIALSMFSLGEAKWWDGGMSFQSRK